MLTTPRSLAGFAAVALVWLAPTAGATVMIEIPLDELAATADVVVRGTVLRSGARLTVRDGELQPRTHTWVHVHEWVKGEGPTVVEIVEVGGAAGGEVWSVLGTPSYGVGEEVLVFLARTPDDRSRFRTHQMVQGQFRVDRIRGEPRVARDLEAVTFARWTEGRLVLEEPGRPPSLRLGDLVARVRGVGRRSGATP